MNDYRPDAHPSDDMLKLMLDEQLPDATCAMIDAHIEECEPCATRLARLAQGPNEEKWRQQLDLYHAANPNGAHADGSPEFIDILGPPRFAAHADDSEVVRTVSTRTYYDIIKLIGSGGMGKVYLAIHRRLRCRVAVKVIKSEGMSEAAVRRFHREIWAVARLKHDNIVKILDAGEVDSVQFFAMEYLDGDSLQQLVKKQGRLPVITACRFVIQAANGLQHAHECEMIHRDIKPGNLMLTKEGSVKLLDFGLARFTSEADAGHTSCDARLGTVNYLSPEQAFDSHSAHETSDIYSLGCTLYYLLTGQAPFPEGTDANRIMAHRHKLAKRLASHRQDVPENLQIVLDKMMAKRPVDRYQSAADVAEALSPFTIPSNGARMNLRPEPHDAKTVKPDPNAIKIVSRPQASPEIATTSTRRDAAENRNRTRLTLAVAVPALLIVALLIGLAIPRARPNAIEPKSITNSLGMKLILIPKGEWPLGADPSDYEAVGGDKTMEKPQHEVWMTRPFYLGMCEVTKGQYHALAGNDPAHFQGSEQSPVEMVSWFDAIEFCNALSVKEHLKPYYEVKGSGADREVTIVDRYGAGYRLPTEAEWEFSCRGKTPTRYSFGDDKAKLDDYAWFERNSDSAPHPVGKKLPNPFGLYDMHGNVWEWCWDQYDESYYAGLPKPAIDPLGPKQGVLRVKRGGAWNRDTPYERSAFRSWLEQDKSFYDIGFRVARYEGAAP